MTASHECKNSGLKSLAELVRLSGVARSTLIDWHTSENPKFQLAIDAALYRREKK